LFRGLFLAQGRGENQRLDVDHFDWLTDVAHFFSFAGSGGFVRKGSSEFADDSELPLANQ
jgi:hypothetical protein